MSTYPLAECHRICLWVTSDKHLLSILAGEGSVCAILYLDSAGAGEGTWKVLTCPMVGWFLPGGRTRVMKVGQYMREGY